MAELSKEQWAKLIDAATPGPWYANFTSHGDPSVVTDPERPSFALVAKISMGPDDYGRANAAFIAAAREAVPALLAEVSQLRAKIEAAVRPIALRFGREYNADNPNAMAQDITEHLTAALAEPPVSDKIDAARAEAVDEITRKIAALQTRRYGIMPPTLGDAIDEVRIQYGLPAFTTDEWSGLS